MAGAGAQAQVRKHRGQRFNSTQSPLRKIMQRSLSQGLPLLPSWDIQQGAGLSLATTHCSRARDTDPGTLRPPHPLSPALYLDTNS